MITLEDWALIRRLASEGVPKSQIAERFGISRNTVTRAVVSDEPPKYERPLVEATPFTPFEERGRSMLAEFPEMPASVLAERVGWSVVLHQSIRVAGWVGVAVALAACHRSQRQVAVGIHARCFAPRR